MSTSTLWQRRFKRLAVFAGTISSLYLLANYTFDRLRESNVRSKRDRQVKDRLKNHFTSLTSTISFTLYALFPTMLPWLVLRYPVEATSQLLQDMSLAGSMSSIQSESEGRQSEGNSHHDTKLMNGSTRTSTGGSESGTSMTEDGSISAVGESWASEFTSSVDATPSTAVSELPQTPDVDSVLIPVRLPIRSALIRAAELAARIRTAQTLLDGNHRTGLTSFILALAESNVLLSPRFSIYTAYLHLSQRHHKGNIDNTLNDEARLAAQNALFQYARRRVRSGTPTFAYLDGCTKAVRELPVEVATVEVAYETLRGSKTEPGTLGQAYRSLDIGTRRRISHAHPDFQPVRGWRWVTAESPLPDLHSVSPVWPIPVDSSAPRILPTLSSILQNHTTDVQKYAKNNYPYQLNYETVRFREHLQQQLGTNDTRRWWQINCFITSAPIGRDCRSGFNDRNSRFKESARLFEIECPRPAVPLPVQPVQPVRPVHPVQPVEPIVTKTKKELWSDIKIQSIARALTTAYLVPLLLLLTSAQLSTLARIRYMSDVKSSLPNTSTPVHPDPTGDEDGPEQSISPGIPKNNGWLKYFSVEAMGLADYVDEKSPGPLSSIVNLFSGLRVNGGSKGSAAAKQGLGTEEDHADAERMYLTYSWWVLHHGGQGVADRVDRAIESVFSRLPLKREMTTEDWQDLLREARAIVETEAGEGEAAPTLYDFTSHLLPPVPLTTTYPDCPLPTHPETSPYLMDLLTQTRQQLSSPDARHVLDKGITEMLKGLAENLGYTTDDESEALSSQRLAACLPPLNRWAMGVWEEVPHVSVEGLLSLPEYESLVALIFGDWA